MTLNLHSIAYPVTALGPGQRLALWVSGCSLNCKGCITPELQAPESGKNIKLDTLVTHLLKVSTQLDGITLTGGEPFEQAEAVTALLMALKQARPNWNVLVFSGYSLSCLRKHPQRSQLLNQVDILVDGVYLQGHNGIHPLTASANQQVHYLSQRGTALRHACESLTINQANLALGISQTAQLIGIIRTPERRQIHQKLSLKHPS